MIMKIEFNPFLERDQKMLLEIIFSVNNDYFLILAVGLKISGAGVVVTLLQEKFRTVGLAVASSLPS